MYKRVPQNNMNNNIERLKEIIKIAYELTWIHPPQGFIEIREEKFPIEYPLMILSEVEKCMLAMIDDTELKRMRVWYEEEKDKTKVNLTEKEELVTEDKEKCKDCGKVACMCYEEKLEIEEDQQDLFDNQ